MSQSTNQLEIQKQTLLSVLLIRQVACGQQQQVMLGRKIQPFWEQSLEMYSIVMDRDIKLWTCYFVFVGLCSFSLFLSPFASGSVNMLVFLFIDICSTWHPPRGLPVRLRHSRHRKRSICCGREAAGVKMFQCFITRRRSGCYSSCSVYFGHI